VESDIGPTRGAKAAISDCAWAPPSDRPVAKTIPVSALAIQRRLVFNFKMILSPANRTANTKAVSLQTDEREKQVPGARIKYVGRIHPR